MANNNDNNSTDFIGIVGATIDQASAVTGMKGSPSSELLRANNDANIVLPGSGDVTADTTEGMIPFTGAETAGDLPAGRR